MFCRVGGGLTEVEVAFWFELLPHGNQQREA